MKKCDYACGSEEHLIARRQFLGGVAGGTGAAALAGWPSGLRR